MLALLFFRPDLGDFERILSNPKLDGAVVSAIITDLNGKVLFDHHSASHVVPASNQKLLSNAFALWELGIDYRPTTSFWKLPDRIVIDSTGDPLMTYEELKKARLDLAPGRELPVYVHEAYAPQIPEGWDYDDLPNKYAAPICSFTFDRGSFTAWSKHGKPILEPKPFGVRIKFIHSQGRPVVHYDPFRKRMTVEGDLSIKDQVLETLALPRPDEAAASIIGRGFEATAMVPASPPDLVITGGSIPEMVRACLPPSDNNIAENLLLMGARKEGELGNQPYVIARKRLKDFLTHVVGIASDDVHPFDGSGLSRQNYLTTRAIAKLLCWANNQKTAAIWRGALAQPGAGTLTTRLKGLNFHGKTGSLNMVSSLSGYLLTSPGKTVIISIIMNGYGCSAAEVRAIQDEFVAAADKISPI